MMLPQLEQMAMYNAINFNLNNNAANSYGFYANSTVTGQRVAGFLCPSDANAGSLSILRAADGRNDMLDLNYVASSGTTTLSPNNQNPVSPNTWYVQGCTGLFWWYKSYGIQSVTDGTSNTVAFSEALVSNGQNTNTYPGNSMTGIAGAGGLAQQYDANQNPAAVLAGLQACNIAWQSGQGLNNARGIFWEIGSLGMTMFNTIAPPNSTQYKWGDCRFTGGGYPNDATFANANSNHPGGCNVLMADGQRPLRQELDQPVHLVVAGDQGQRRGDLLRLLLIGIGPAARGRRAGPGPGLLPGPVLVRRERFSLRPPSLTSKPVRLGLTSRRHRSRSPRTANPGASAAADGRPSREPPDTSEASIA